MRFGFACRMVMRAFHRLTKWQEVTSGCQQPQAKIPAKRSDKSGFAE
jgi:hypothetical protein